jgi:hypothetical protein
MALAALPAHQRVVLDGVDKDFRPRYRYPSYLITKLTPRCDASSHWNGSCFTRIPRGGAPASTKLWVMLVSRKPSRGEVHLVISDLGPAQRTPLEAMLPSMTVDLIASYGRPLPICPNCDSRMVMSCREAYTAEPLTFTFECRRCCCVMQRVTARAIRGVQARGRA